MCLMGSALSEKCFPFLLLPVSDRRLRSQNWSSLLQLLPIAPARNRCNNSFPGYGRLLCLSRGHTPTSGTHTPIKLSSTLRGASRLHRKPRSPLSNSSRDTQLGPVSHATSLVDFPPTHSRTRRPHGAPKAWKAPQPNAPGPPFCAHVCSTSGGVPGIPSALGSHHSLRDSPNRCPVG